MVDRMVEDDSFVFKMPPLLDLRNGSDTKEEILKAFERRSHSSFVIDLCDLEFIDSYGIGVLIRLQKKMLGSGKKLCFVHARDSIKKVFEIVKIREFINLIDD